MIDNNGILHLQLVLVLASCLSLAGVGSTSASKPKIQPNGRAAPGEEGGGQQRIPLERVSVTRGPEVLMYCENEDIKIIFMLSQ